MLEWLPILGFEGLYEVSSEGDIRTLRRQGTDARVLSRNAQPNGYEKVCLYRGCKRTAKWVHRLVLEAFVGPAPSGMVACHGDGNPSNNAVANLRWDTPSANFQDSVKHGTAATGSRNGGYKLVPAMRRQIAELRAQGLPHRAIAKSVGLAPSTVLIALKENAGV